MKVHSRRIHSRRYAVLFFLLCLLFVTCPFFGRADMGPKPTLTIVVKHPPEEEYYLDLLLPEKGDFDNLQERRSNYDAAKLELLHSCENEGWYPALAGGSVSVPLSGDLIGERDGASMRHVFSYLGVPDHFRVAIVTPDKLPFSSASISVPKFC